MPALVVVPEQAVLPLGRVPPVVMLLLAIVAPPKAAAFQVLVV